MLHLRRSVLALLTGCCVSTGFLLLPTEAALAASPDPSASLPTLACAAGLSSIIPSSSSVTGDGWLNLSYTIAGAPVTREIPPAGFDPTHASDQVIASHHLSARPAATADLPTWASGIKALRAGALNLCLPSSPKTTPMHGQQYYHISWGGDEMRWHPTTYQFDGVRAHYTQPTLNNSYCTPLRAVSSWVGLGGDDPNTGNARSLAQVGTDVLGPGWQGYPTYEAFYEIMYPQKILNPPVYFPNPVAGAASMYAEVDIDATDQLISFYITDYSQGWSALVNVPFPTSFDYSWGNGSAGQGAEWVDERPWNNYIGYAPLMNYGWTYWSSMAVHRSNSAPSSWTPAYNEPTEWWLMMTSDGQPYHSGKNVELSQTTGTYSDSHMQNHWHACG